MTPDDAAPFEAAMIALAAVTGKELDQFIKRAYFTGLERVPIGTLQGAFKLAMQGCEFFPSVAELLRLCDEFEADQRGELVLTAPVERQLKAGEPEPIEEVYDGEWGPVPYEGKTYGCAECGDTGFTHYVCSNETPCPSDLCRKRRQQGIVDGERWARKCACTKIDPVTGKCANPVIQRRIDDGRKKQGLPPLGTYARPKKGGGKSYRRYEED